MLIGSMYSLLVFPCVSSSVFGLFPFQLDFLPSRLLLRMTYVDQGSDVAVDSHSLEIAIPVSYTHLYRGLVFIGLMLT